MKPVRLSFPTYDGAEQVRVAHGDRCVVLLLESPAYVLRNAAILSSKEVAALGRRLLQQAKAANEVGEPAPDTEPADFRKFGEPQG